MRISTSSFSLYKLALVVIFRKSTYRNVNGDNGDGIGYMQFNLIGIRSEWSALAF